jgi:hypothetical protein
MVAADDLTPTRRALHAVAEHVLAGPQHAASDTVRLRVVGGGFSTTRLPDVRLEGGQVTHGGISLAVSGSTARRLLDGLGLTPSSLAQVYSDGTDVGLDDPLDLDTAAYDELTTAWAWGDAALRRMAPQEEPVLWPEHFDVGISLDGVNYGVSPGDSAIGVPYAYVGPWPPPPVGGFWTHQFGAARTLAELGDADGIAAFFAEGRSLTS